MHGVLPADPQRSIFPDAQPCTDDLVDAQLCSDVGGDGWFGRMAVKLWPKKTAAYLEYLTRAKSRVCHYWVAGREPGAGVLVTLLRGSEGRRVLEHVMRGSDARWWADIERDRLQAASARQHHEQFRLQFPAG